MSGCEHVGPSEIMAMAESWLREHGVPEERWPGIKVRHAENTPGTMWESVVIEIERRGGQWIVTAIDRRRQPLEEREGLSVLGERIEN